MYKLYRCRFVAGILLYLSGAGLAQSLSNCPTELRRLGDSEDRLVYNSTRTLSYKFKGQSRPWYITAAVTDVRPPNGEFINGANSGQDSRQELSVFVSVPRGYGTSRDGRDIRVCSHMMASINKTTDNADNAEYSCRGVISEKCIEEYENATLSVPALGQECPDFTSLRPKLSEECTNQVFAGNEIVRNFSATRCSLDEMPHLNLPANYTTFSGNWAGFDGDYNGEDFDRYDRRVQKTIPVLMSVAKGNDSSESKLLCIAPNQVVAGSRKPESKLEDEEDENLASQVRVIPALDGARLYFDHQSRTTGLPNNMFKTLTLTWLFLLGTCLAQNFSLPEDCSPGEFLVDDWFRNNVFFNASGTLPLKLKGQKDPWYISTAITDERDPKRPGRSSIQWMNSFISVPRPLVESIDNETIEVSLYTFQGLNSSSENPGDTDGSCKGVISDACIEEVENSTLTISNRDARPIPAALNLTDECKKHLTFYQSFQPLNISTGNCTIDDIPHLDVPDGYWTYGVSLSSGEDGGADYDFDSYDMRVQQTVPIFAVVSGGDISDGKMICIAPNKVVPGSRKPELKLEETEDEDKEENTASRVRGLGAVFLGFGVMIFNILRGPNIVFGDVDTLQEVGVFISVHKTLADPRYPAGRDIRLCSSMLKASNRTSENPPDIDAPENITYAKHSCKGVISEKCIREFENATYTATGRPRKCPGLQSLDFSDECKEYIGHSQTIPRNFSSARCSVDKMPYVDLPEDYITFDIGLGVGIFGDEDRKDFDTYDLRVQQTIPLLFSASPGAGKNTLICIAPDQVIPGSRKPQLELEGEAEELEEDEEPEDDENLASRVGGLGASVFLGVGAIIFSLL
ncbi:hypothetical protein CEK25_005405 [Fusarium fujikuroi]|nr:hypothetical protein CEK25_005405 [Fusarium fujikuroi]